MRDFKNIKSIDELLKKATVTVLLNKITYSKEAGVEIMPVQCPAITDNKEGPKYNADNQVVCMLNMEECPFFESAIFDINGYIKEISCKAR
jgi:hypothetical protein